MKKKFNILFCDPPYADHNFIQNLKLIRKKLFKLNHIIIIHRERQEKDNFHDLIKVITEKIWKIKNYFWKIYLKN